jgi:predicted RNA-binding protein
MCDIKVRLLEESGTATSFENVTNLEIREGSICVESMFEEPRELSGVVIDKIDCLRHTVVLRRVNSGVQEGGHV